MRVAMDVIIDNVIEAVDPSWLPLLPSELFNAARLNQRGKRVLSHYLSDQTDLFNLHNYLSAEADDMTDNIHRLLASKKDEYWQAVIKQLGALALARYLVLWVEKKKVNDLINYLGHEIFVRTLKEYSLQRNLSESDNTEIHSLEWDGEGAWKNQLESIGLGNVFHYIKTKHDYLSDSVRLIFPKSRIFDESNLLSDMIVEQVISLVLQERDELTHD